VTKNANCHEEDENHERAADSNTFGQEKQPKILRSTFLHSSCNLRSLRAFVGDPLILFFGRQKLKCWISR